MFWTFLLASTLSGLGLIHIEHRIDISVQFCARWLGKQTKKPELGQNQAPGYYNLKRAPVTSVTSTSSFIRHLAKPPRAQFLTAHPVFQNGNESFPSSFTALRVVRAVRSESIAVILGDSGYESIPRRRLTAWMKGPQGENDSPDRGHPETHDGLFTLSNWDKLWGDQ